MDNFFSKLISVTLVPIQLLNVLGGIVGGVWLIFIGGWRIVLFAFIGTIVFTWVYSLVLMIISAPLGLLVVYLINKKRHKIAMVVGFLNMLITNVINLLWVLYILFGAFSIGERLSLAPMLLIGYAVATGPFSYMASHESQDSLGTYVAVYLTEISYIFAVIFILLGLGFLTIPVMALLALCFSLYLARVGYTMLKQNPQQV